MCGITGILHWGSVKDCRLRIDGMVESMRHRGPDDTGKWHNGSISFGFTRLSILDLEGGKQPMRNEDGNVVVVFNGEIYNHRELRKELEDYGHIFITSHSDTEVLVHGYEQWGKGLVPRLNGMFAFAVWDNIEKGLFIARDRYGIKPLYVSGDPQICLIFGSEIRPILASGIVEKKGSVSGLLEYLSFQNLISNRTMFEGIRQFPAGTWEYHTKSISDRFQYWDISFPRNSTLSLNEAAEAHRSILKTVVKRQIEADVPVMSYLSGGIDSSSLTSIAHKYNPNIRSYSCLFDIEGVGDDRISDEREYSREMAHLLNNKHIEIELPQDILKDTLNSTINALEYPIMGMMRS